MSVLSNFEVKDYNNPESLWLKNTCPIVYSTAYQFVAVSRFPKSDGCSLSDQLFAVATTSGSAESSTLTE